MSSFINLWNSRVSGKLGTASQKANAAASDLFMELRTIDTMSEEVKLEYDLLVDGYKIEGMTDTGASCAAGLKFAEMIGAEVAKAGG